MAEDKNQFWGMCCGGCCCFGIFFVIFFVFPFVFVTTEDTERAVVYSRLFARFQEDTIDTGGFHTKPYNAKLIRWPRIEETVEFNTAVKEGPDLRNIVCNSADGVLIDMIISFQFFPNQTELVFLTKEFSSYGNWKRLMILQANAAIRHVCGDFIADDFQTNRAQVAVGMENEVRSATASNEFRAIITKLQLKQVQRPQKYENAVRDKENARSEIRLAENEESQALTKAQTKVDVAREEALRIIDSAQTEAEIRTAQASADREAIIDRFTQLGEVLSLVKTQQGLSVKGILTYISNEIFMDDVTIAVDAPVQVTFKDEL